MQVVVWVEAVTVEWPSYFRRRETYVFHETDAPKSDIQNPFSATLARGVQDSLERDRYMTIIVNTDGDPDKELQGLREIYRRGVDGLIIAPPQRNNASEHNRYIVDRARKNFPIVTVGNWLKDPKVDFVTSRAQDGAIAAIDHLVGLGHEKIAFYRRTTRVSSA